MTSTLRSKIELLIADPQLLDHHIARDAGVALSAVQRIRNGQAKLDNIQLLTAEKLANYYDQKRG